MATFSLTVRVWRGPLVESEHRCHLAVVNSQGGLLHSAGNESLITYARSTAKPIQAIPVIESGAFDRFGFTETELALFCASHGGEAPHAAAAAAALGKIGLSGDALQCGAHYPFHEPSASAMRETGERPTALHNNCSGKHTAMLALAVQLGAPIESYLSIDHPVQQYMLRTVSDMSGLPTSDIAIGVDGCGVPVFGMPLNSLALAYARLGAPSDLIESQQTACGRILNAITAHPFFLAGSGRFDTDLIHATNGRIVGKMGAEGVYALTIPQEGIGLALKIEDGSNRALYPAVNEALLQLGLITEQEAATLKEHRITALRNWQGTLIGRIEPNWTQAPAAE